MLSEVLHCSLLVALCEDGQLLVLCCQTLLLLLLWNKFSVQDMILLDSPSADDEGTFLLLTQSHEDKISYIQIVSLPGTVIQISLILLWQLISHVRSQSHVN